MKTLVKVTVTHDILIEVDPELTPPELFHECMNTKIDSIIDVNQVKQFFEDMDCKVLELKVGINTEEADSTNDLLEAIKEVILEDDDAPESLKEAIRNNLPDDTGVIVASSLKELVNKMRDEGLPDHLINEVEDDLKNDSKKTRQYQQILH